MIFPIASSLSILFVALAGPANGFTPFVASVRPATFLRADSDSANVAADASSFIKAAFEASEKYGASSPEAQLAWEAVEEIDARNSRG